MTVPHGVVERGVEIAAIGVRNVHADVQARNRQRVGDVDRVGDPDRVVLGNRAIWRRCSLERRRRCGCVCQQAPERDRLAGWGDLLDRQIRRGAVPPFAVGHRGVGEASECPGKEIPGIAHLIPLAFELEQSVGLFQRQLVVASARHLLVAVVAVFVHVPDGETLVWQ